MRPAFPIEDSAFFEYYGRALTQGAHLYTDLWDTKLPSIYYLNAFWWLAFGDHFRLHQLAESLINGVMIAIFAALLKALQVRRWDIGTLVFAICYLIIGGPNNQTEHYATPLILAGLLAGVCKRDILAGILLASASTFWLPAAAVGLAPLLATLSPRRCWFVTMVTCVTAAAYGAAFLAFFHVATTVELVSSWLPYVAHAYNTDGEYKHRVPFLAPRYYLQSGLALMVCLIATFWQRDARPGQRFAFTWAGAALVVVFASGRPFIHYFLPVYPGLAMLFALQPLEAVMFRRRWYFAGAAGLCAVSMIVAASIDARRYPASLVHDAMYIGNVIRANYGPKVTAVLPWEIYLTADARPPSRFTFTPDTNPYAESRDIWPSSLELLVQRQTTREATPPTELSLACKSASTQPWVLFTKRPLSGIPCVPRRTVASAGLANTAQP